jgi:hypothetical protein
MVEELFKEVSPNENVQALVEADENVCYFYLFGADGTGFGPPRAVWVRNIAEAPESFESERMRSGAPPRNPKAHCKHPQGLRLPKPDQLRIVWLPEGDGAAIYEGDELLAAIPPWSGMGGFQGYARDAIGEGPVAWEITADNALVDRFREAENYWQQWDEGDARTTIQESLLSGIEGTLGPHKNYYAIDGGHWPPKAIVRIARPDCVVLVTVGVSARPQPKVEMSTEQPELLWRIELGVVLPDHWPDDAIKQFGAYLSGQSSLPWKQYTWLGPGHTIPRDAWLNRSFAFALLTTEHPAIPTLKLGPQFGNPVNILWFLPISATERQIAMEKGSAELLEILPIDRWKQAYDTQQCVPP